MFKAVEFAPDVIAAHPLLSPDAERHVVLMDDADRHALPAYEAEGLSMIPVPVFSWKRGQSIDQTLLDLQMHLFGRMLAEAPAAYTRLFAPVGAYVRYGRPLPAIPEADIVCFGLWVSTEEASQRRVFCMSRQTPDRIENVVDCPTVELLRELAPTHLTLMDTGIWLVTPRAEALLRDHTLGELAETLHIAVLPLEDADFYPFTTTAEMVESTMRLQNAVQDQRLILQRNVKTIPSLFTQNSYVKTPLTVENANIWIENSHVPASWTVTQNNVITGVPENDWTVNLHAGQCIRVLPVGAEGFALTVYDYHDACRCITEVVDNKDQLKIAFERLLSTASPEQRESSSGEYLEVSHVRLNAQRAAFLKDNLAAIANNHQKSVFYQVNLKDMAQKFCNLQIPTPAPLGDEVPTLTQIRDAMFRSQLETLRGNDGSAHEQRAFSLLQDGLAESAFVHRQMPHLDVYRDQIVWGRSAVRIDVAGGWTDTPPYCLNTGGNVVNLAIELNGQQPLQVYVKPCKDLKVICRSIDLGASEVFETYEELAQFNKVGSPFSIPKAALALCGFLPQFCKERYATLRDQLADFGCGLEITLLSAIPAGSGLGTSSILAATVLGALSDFCGLGWDKSTICNRTLILEQLLTTGGGWQDQYGGVLHGVKLLQTGAGFDQTPVARWLPDQLWNDPEMRACHLLYYTGITRTAKHILAEIVRGMFLNSNEHLTLLGEMKQQALDMFDAIQHSDIDLYGRLVRKTWAQNKALDAGTEPPLVAELCSRIDDLCAGYKLPGAGGGGYLYMVAKDPDAAARIRRILQENPLTDSSRFVDMRLSKKGLEVSRS
ncbi:MAG: bifunctional fucokinase/fucose-1-phosphate guanylyltransferase [Bacteroidales bacterium]|nr:bifunctional fucokinase/fucose-1-phosphate guanylyltransferase [Bacteroidales bacterium]